MKIVTVADVPDWLAKAWLQHLRDFDTMHPGCHFEIMAEAPQMTTAEFVEAVRIDPGFDVMQVFERKK